VKLAGTLAKRANVVNNGIRKFEVRIHWADFHVQVKGLDFPIGVRLIVVKPEL